MTDTTKAQQIQNYNKQATTTTVITTSSNAQKPASATEENKNAQLSDKAEQIKAKASDTEEAKTAKEKQKLEEKRQEELQQKQNDLLMQAGHKIDEGQEAVSNAATPFVQWLGRQPTYGGIGTLVAILVFFWLAIIPVNQNGDTRLKLIYLTLTGKTQLQYEGNISSGDFGPNSGGSTGNNGNGSNVTTIPIPTPTPIIPLTTPVQPTLPVNNTGVFVGSNGNSLLNTNDVFNLLGFGE